MNRLRRDESGITLVELLITCVVLGIVMAGLVNVFVSGTRASSDSGARLTGQQNTRLALDRLEWEGRCAQTATILASGTGVYFSIPGQCSHVTGSVSWCVVSGVLRRYSATTCTGTSHPYVTGITSTAFSLFTTSGYLPRLHVLMTVNTTRSSSDAVAVDDTIALRNAARTP